MKPIFKQAVALKCSRKYFDNQLQDELIALGYDNYVTESTMGGNTHICTRWFNEKHRLGYGSINHLKPSHKRIEVSSRDLFLAVAAMTEGNIPIIGEYLTIVSTRLDGIEKGHIFQCKEYCGYNNSKKGQISKSNPTGNGAWRKATLQELMDHFDESYNKYTKDKFPEKWCVKGDRRQSQVGSLKQAEYHWFNSLGLDLFKDAGFYVGYYYHKDGIITGKVMPSYKLVTKEQLIAHFNKQSNEQIRTIDTGQESSSTGRPCTSSEIRQVEDASRLVGNRISPKQRRTRAVESQISPSAIST